MLPLTVLSEQWKWLLYSRLATGKLNMEREMPWTGARNRECDHWFTARIRHTLVADDVDQVFEMDFKHLRLKKRS